MEKNTFSSPSYWDSTINWMESVTTKQRNVQIRIESVVLLAWSLLMKGDRVSSHNCLIPVSCLLSHVSCLYCKNETFTEFHCNLSTVVRFRKNVTSLPHVWIYLCFLSRMQSTFIQTTFTSIHGPSENSNTVKYTTNHLIQTPLTQWDCLHLYTGVWCW